MILSRTLALMAAAALLGLAGCLSHPEPRPGRTTIKRDGTVIPAHVIGSHFLVDGKWDKHGPWHFLVDTGSSITLVSEAFAKQYAEKIPAGSERTVKITSADGDAVTLPAVTLRRLSLGTARFEYADALVADLSEISRQLGVQIDAVLSFPLFRDSVFTLDYPNQRLVIEPSDFEKPRLGSRLTFDNDLHTPVIPVQLGNSTLKVLVDSGSDGPLFLNPDRVDVHYVAPPRLGTTVGTLNGSRLQHIARLKETLAIGDYRFPEPIADLTDQLSSIGGEILKNFSVTFDEAHHAVTFARDTAGPISTPARRSSGLAFSKGPTYWRVVSVIPDSPAAELGIKPGDLVTRINGEAISKWPLERFDPLVKRSTEIVFTFLDGAKEKPVVVATFDLVP